METSRRLDLSLQIFCLNQKFVPFDFDARVRIARAGRERERSSSNSS